jgi:DNA-nicking Smr family endonuclease
MSRRKRTLTEEERQLWSRIRESVTPLPGKAVDAEIEEWIDHAGESVVPAAIPEQRKKPVFPPARPAEPFLPPYVPSVSAQRPGEPVFDDKTLKKLRKGKLDIDARIDLHGMTEAAAHDALLRFVREERRRDSRIVLVITGKGKGGEGVLRRAVPLWFAEAAFRPLLGSWRKAHPSHGGDGAIYLRLKREGRT